MTNGEKIKLIREELGMTQEVFAKRLNVNPQNIRDLEHGKVKKIKDEVLRKLVRDYSVNLEWLVLESGEPFKNTSSNIQKSRDITGSTLVNGSFNGSTNSNVSVGGGDGHNGIVKGLIDKIKQIKDDRALWSLDLQAEDFLKREKGMA